MNKKICILDFSTAKVYYVNVPKELENEQAETIIQGMCKELGIREDDTQYMLGNLELIETI